MKTLDRRSFMKSVLAGTAVSVLPGCSTLYSGNAKARRPNFIIFLADDLGYGDLACYGNPIIKTPHLDKFASQGMKFTDCHAAGTVCSPSRASLLTGRTPYRIGFYSILGRGDIHLRREEITVASLLRNQGYDTCFVGKWHMTNINNPQSDQPNPGDHGFNHWFATQVNAFGSGPENHDKYIRNGEKVGQVDGWYCDVIVQEALDWLKTRPDRNKPFLLVVCSHEPHTPVAPPEEYTAMYDNEQVEKLEKTIEYGKILRTDRDITENKKYYYGTVTQLDNAFGTLIKGIDKMGLKDNSLVFFTSDNGPETPVSIEESGGRWNDKSRDRCFGTPGVLKGMKRNSYEGGHRVPGIARWPGHIKPGSKCSELVNGTDFLPTLCELAKAKPPTDRVIDGSSIVPLFSGKKIKRHMPQCWLFPTEYYFIPHMAMREGDYVIIGWFNEKKGDQTHMEWVKSARLQKFELYNLNKDLDQSENLTEKEPQRLKTMSAKMKKLWLEIQTEGPTWNWNRGRARS